MTLQVERRGRIAVVRLAKPRGNSIDDALADDLARAARELADDDGVGGLLLASAHPKLFCPGLDLVALAGHDRPAMRSFMRRFGAAIDVLYGLRKPVVAAVSGAAVAGGCILALTADLRLLRRGAAIGLNELRIGVPLPWPVTVLLRASVPASALARIALVGRNFADAEAVAAGLADEVCESEGFEEACLARLDELAERDAWAFATTKAWLREGTLREMRAQEEERLEAFLDGWFSAPTQERIRGVAGSLSKG